MHECVSDPDFTVHRRLLGIYLHRFVTYLNRAYLISEQVNRGLIAARFAVLVSLAAVFGGKNSENSERPRLEATSTLTHVATPLVTILRTNEGMNAYGH